MLWAPKEVMKVMYPLPKQGMSLHHWSDEG